MRKNFGAKPMIYPMPVLIIASYDEAGIPDAMNAAWGGITGDDQISMCLSAGHKTVKNILAKKAFTVSFADVPHLPACDYVGIESGNKVPNKLAKAGFHTTKSELVDAPLIDELPLSLECELVSYDEESCVLVGKILNVSAEESVLDEKGNVDIKKLQIITYDPSGHGYYAIGDKVGNAFCSGKTMKSLDGTTLPGRGKGMAGYKEYCNKAYDMKIYPVSPYHQVYHVAENVWTIWSSWPSGRGSNLLHLIEGPEKALLIDNSYGIGDLKGLCEMLVGGKEVLCAVTHSHEDHAYGSMQWDEVYCHDICAKVLERDFGPDEESFRKTWEPTLMMSEDSFFTKEDLVPYNPNLKFIHLQDHAIINLGEDYDIELIHMGGHAPGLSCFLDKKSRTLYSGDAIFEALDPGLGIGLNGRRGFTIFSDTPTIQPFSEYMTTEFFHGTIKALAARVDEFDTVRDGHGSMDSPARVVTDLCEAIEAVLEDPYAYTACTPFLGKENCYMQRGMANVRYLPEYILD